MDFLEKRIQSQFKGPIGDLRGTADLIREELGKAKKDRNRSRELLDELKQASTEIRSLLAALDERLPSFSPRLADQIVPAPEGPVAEMCLGANLKVLDVGGRLGSVGQLQPLAPFAHLYTCEPEAEAATQLPELLAQKEGWREVTLFREALAASEGKVTLNVTRQPGLSSLLVPDEKVVRQYYDGTDWEVTSTEEIPALTLDGAAERYGFTDVSFLKVDTQGSELEILRSGPRALGSAVAVYVEMENQPFYRGQPCLADVDAFLRDAGFTLVDLKRTALRRSGGLKASYSKRELTWVHGLYFRTGNGTFEGLSLSQLHRLLAIAVLLEYFDLALELARVPPLREHLAREYPGGDMGHLIGKQSSRVFFHLAGKRRAEFQSLVQAFCHRDRKWER